MPNPYLAGTFIWAVWHVENGKRPVRRFDGGRWELYQDHDDSLSVTIFRETTNAVGYIGHRGIGPAHVFAAGWEVE